MSVNRLQDFETFSRALDAARETIGPGSGGMVTIASEDRARIATMMITAAETVCNVSDASRMGKIRAEADRFASCGSVKRIFRCSQCNHQYKGQSSCNSRICPTCSRRYGRKVLRRLRSDLRPFWSSRRPNTYGPKFLTLTFMRRYLTEVPGSRDLKRAQKEVRQFLIRFYGKYDARRSKSGRWYTDRKKYRGCGAVAVPEIGEEGTLHFHCLVYGPYISQARLAQAWYEITGDSMVLEIEDAQKLDDGCRYVTKYICKPPAKALTSHGALAMWALALKGSRRLIVSGTMWGRLKGDKESRACRMQCLYCGTVLDYVGLGEDPDDILIDISRVYAHYARDGDNGVRDPVPLMDPNKFFFDGELRGGSPDVKYELIKKGG